MAVNDRTTTVRQLKGMMARFIREREWGKYHRPKNLAMSIAIEAGELMEHFQWKTPEECDALVRHPRTRRMIADEMADVLAFLLSLSSVTGIDLASSLKAKDAGNRRKYPVARFRGAYRRPRRR